MKRFVFLYVPGFIMAAATTFITGCSSAPVASRNWMREAHTLALLPIGLEFAENVTNVTRRIDGKGGASNRFQRVDFFSECYNSMSGQERIWYALLYCAQHQLDGESLLTYRIVTMSDSGSVVALAHRLRESDWQSIGVCLGVEGSIASRRVKGVFSIR
jgi:hypothetical protein